MNFRRAGLIALCIVIAAASARSGSDATPTAVDPSTRDDVLAAIDVADLYVLDVENIVMHVHAQLDVRVDGRDVTVPQVGVDYDTLTAAPIHTHDETGRLHIEADRTHAERELLLIDFLRLWAGAYTSDDLCRYFAATDTCRVAVSVDGRESGTNLVLADGQQITVAISTDTTLTA